MEIIPAIDIRGGKCVRLRQGDYTRETVYGDDPVLTAERWAAEGAARLHIVDLDGAKAGSPVNHELVRRIVESLQIPCQFGGGIRDDEAAKLLLDDVGVNRIVIGTQALKEPAWFRDVVDRHPGRVALGLDARGANVATDGWLEVSETPAVELADGYRNLPLAAVIYTNIANDGMMQGVDPVTLQTLAALAGLGLPVIASGGVTTAADVRQLAEIAKTHPKLVAAIVGRSLYEGELTLAAAHDAAALP